MPQVSDDEGRVYRLRPERWPPAGICQGVSSRTGLRCQRYANRSSLYCSKHGGLLQSCQDVQLEEVEAAKSRILASLPELVDRLIDSALDETVPAYVRAKISFELLSRVGLMPEQRIELQADVHDSRGQSAGEVVRERLARLAAAAQVPEQGPDAATRTASPVGGVVVVSGPVLPG